MDIGSQMDRSSIFAGILTIAFTSIFIGCAHLKEIEQNSASEQQKSVSSQELKPNTIMSFSGVLVSGFESYYFSPDGLDQKWWIDYGSNKAKGWKIVQARLDAIKCDKNLMYENRKVPCNFQGKSTKLTAKAIVTDKGAYGHLGRYERQIKFIEILK